MFLRTDTTLSPFYVLVYVDDLVFAVADTEALAYVKSKLQKIHTCTDLGELTSYLGLQITRDRAQRTITLTQSHMVQQVLLRFGFTYSSPRSTPLPTGHSLSAPPLDESVEPSGPYPELVGCLITSGMGLVLGGRARVFLTCHTDASWVDDLATQRSSQGYTFSLGSGSVSWGSTRSSSSEGLGLESQCVHFRHPSAGGCQSALPDPRVLCLPTSATTPLPASATAPLPARAARQQPTPGLRLARAHPTHTHAHPACALHVRTPPCPGAASATTATADVTALAHALLPTHPTSLHSHSNSRYYRPCAAATDCHYLSWPLSRDCVEAAALGASESAATLGASESAAALGASASTATVPSGSLLGLHLPSFSTDLVSNAVLQDVWVDTFIPGGQRVAICTCSRTGRHLATFTRQPGSSLYTLTTASAQVAASGQVAGSIQVSASSQLAASCSSRVLSHHTLFWNHCLCHPSLPCLRSMHSRLLVSGLPRSLPPLPRSPAPPCLPCVEGRQRAAPHSSKFPPTTAPLQTLHKDV
ncbi:unnamed protein product [Closterium sp. NIES-53]